MVGIVECVQQIFVEWVDVLESGEAVEDRLELLTEGLRGELDFSGVETCKMSVVGLEYHCELLTSYPADFEAGSDLRREFPLGTG